MQITAHDIHVTIDDRDILNKVSVDAASGTSLALTGPAAPARPRCSTASACCSRSPRGRSSSTVST
ncbi:MAG: hypothetical protein Q4D89_01845 [Arachnia propionica]|uniref:hypothetical protein n=1 Tax=Arachnia propionica TaxID=1750 RepID=UPI00270752A1|nr:hypothetical protein [Arachnia propionica]